MKAGVTRNPTTALRAAYLDALADLIIETVDRDGASVFAAADETARPARGADADGPSG